MAFNNNIRRISTGSQQMNRILGGGIELRGDKLLNIFKN